VALLTVALAAPPAPAVADEQGDFVLRRDGSKAVPVSVPEPAGPADGFDWGDAGIGAGAGVAALLAAAAGAQFARSRHAARRSPLSAAGS
jgi:hypothetical protein